MKRMYENILDTFYVISDAAYHEIVLAGESDLPSKQAQVGYLTVTACECVGQKPSDRDTRKTVICITCPIQ